MKCQYLVYVVSLFLFHPAFTSDTSNAAKGSAFTKLFKDCSPAELLERAKYFSARRISLEIESQGVALSQVPEKLKAMFHFNLYKNLYSVTVYGVQYDKYFLKGVNGQADILAWKKSSMPAMPCKYPPLISKPPFGRTLGSGGDFLSQQAADKITTYMMMKNVAGIRRKRDE
jgi:hypothetical protein